MAQTRLLFELDVRAEAAALTAHGGVPLLIEAFRVSGAAAVLDASVVIKRRKRGLRPSELVEGLFSLWAAGGERCEDLAPLREASRSGPTTEVGPGSQGSARSAARTRACRQRRRRGTSWTRSTRWYHRCGGVSGARSRGEGERLQGLAQANRRLIGFLQERRPQAMATLDVDATILESQKRAARWTYDGRTGYQPVVALWAEQDVILADEFRDGNVPAGTGNRRLVEQALAALPAGIAALRVRGDSALYEQSRCAGWRGVALATRSAPT